MIAITPMIEMMATMIPTAVRSCAEKAGGREAVEELG